MKLLLTLWPYQADWCWFLNMPIECFIDALFNWSTTESTSCLCDGSLSGGKKLLRKGGSSGWSIEQGIYETFKLACWGHQHQSAWYGHKVSKQFHHLMTMLALNPMTLLYWDLSNPPQRGSSTPLNLGPSLFLLTQSQQAGPLTVRQTPWYWAIFSSGQASLLYLL